MSEITTGVQLELPANASGTGENVLPANSQAVPTRPRGSNADEWNLFLSEYPREYCAVQIAEAIDDVRRRAGSAYFQLQDFNYNHAREILKGIIDPWDQ